ncbi:MAG: Fic family protein [Oscillospiraceae bacterium]|nr:Fic family protein [Oscillospiraceae bacterium]
MTNKIEGVHSSRKEIGEALEILESQSENKKGKSSRFIGLVNKYLKLITSERIPLQSCQDFRSIYDEVFLVEVTREDASNQPDGILFRKDSVSVYGETEKVIHTGVYPESEIIKCMEQAIRFLNDESIDQLFRVCLFHYLTEYIHPFYDGNGRIGRFVLSYGISQTLSPIIAFRISETIKENIKSYYKAFQICNDPRNLGDLTPFLIMQLTMIHEAMNELVISLKGRKATWDKYEKAINEYHNGDHQLAKLYSFLIQAALFSEMGISTQELENYMNCSSYIRCQLMQKIPPELITVTKKGNRNYYSINLNHLDEEIKKKSIEHLT